jgi:Domain of unknown function (DUF4116)
MRLRELYTTVLVESVADVIKRLKTTYPDQVPFIDERANWIRKTFPKGAEWYMLIIGDQLSGDQDKLQKRLGPFLLFELNKLPEILEHYASLDYQPIKDYAFNAKTVQEVLADLKDLEEKWKLLPSRPVHPQEGDHIIQDYGNGFQWWFVDRAFCSDEGRSGKHCGNVTGRDKTDQRILSLRQNMKVVLTFILEPNGFLGEMKAVGNQKPNPKYHSYIMDLLLSNMVKGIQGAGYIPEFNFSVFDLDENNLNILIQAGKSILITTQIQATPREIFRAPDFIKNNPEYQQVAISKDKNLSNFFVNGKMDNSIANWEKAIAVNPKYVIHAPQEVNNYREKVTAVLTNFPNLLMECPRAIIKDEEFILSLVGENSNAFQYVPPAGKTMRLCKTVVSKHGSLLKDVPEEMRTQELCKLAVANSGIALKHTPEKFKTQELVDIATNTTTSWKDIPDKFHTYEMAKKAVATNGWNIQNIPKSFVTAEIAKIAVTNMPLIIKLVPPELQTKELLGYAVTLNGTSIEHLPKDKRTPDLAILALPTYGRALEYIPKEHRTLELCKIALKENANALEFVPQHLRTPEMVAGCIKQFGNMLRYIPDEHRTPELCKLAVESTGHAILHVPTELKTPELCKLAVGKDGNVLVYIPEHLITPEVCYTAVKQDGDAIAFVPDELNTLELCKLAISTKPTALHAISPTIGENDPDAYFELCKTAMTLANKIATEYGYSENFGSPLELLNDSSFRSYLNQEQQDELENMAVRLPNDHQ